MSSGKVNCTCGWSWNKSDSSAKDMYVCHECGKDNSNNMQNGGWLDSYADGGTMQEHQENYNNSNASAPEGFQGDGYSNVGRNYSPAWGGQFQEGGEIPNAQIGKKVKYVESKNDPRYKAYQDSLKVYNEGNSKYNNIKKTGNLKDLKVDVDSEKKLPFNKFIKEYGYNDNAFNLFNEGTNKNMKPISISHFRGDGILGYLDYGNQALYKKPTQPVEVKKEKVDLRPIYVTDKNDPRINQYTEAGRQYLYKKPQEPVIVKPKEKLVSLQPMSRGLIDTDQQINNTDINIPVQGRVPQYYNIQDTNNQNFGGGDTSYRVDSLDELRELPKEQWDRKITPNYQMGGTVAGAPGFSYARTKGIPYNGPGAKKTMASAQNGQEMKYYQEGLDWKPKNISQNGGWLNQYDVAQEGEELPSVRSLINDTMNRKIQSKGKEVKTVQKDNAKTIIPKEIKKLSGVQQNKLAQKQSEEQAAKDWVQNSMQEAYKSPLMSPGYFTPEGAAIGAMESALKVGPDLYEGNYGSAAINAIGALPAVASFGPELRSIKTSIAPELREGLHTNGFLDIFKSKPKSEINWGNWNKEIPNNPQLMKEYNAIEQQAKADGSWMKYSDGSDFNGTPEQFIQMQHPNTQNFAGGIAEAEQMYKKPLYRGAHRHVVDFKNRDRNDFATFLTDSEKNAETYATSDGGVKKYFHPDVDKEVEAYGKFYPLEVDGKYQLSFPQNLPTVEGKANGNNWRFLDYDKKIDADGIRAEINKNSFEHNLDGKKQYQYDYPENFDINKNYLSTDDYANYVKNNSTGVAKIENVKDQMGYVEGIPANTVYAVDAKKVPIKSLRYNNGMFDMTNPNIYKAIVPGAIGLGALGSIEKQKEGGIIKDDRGQWDHPGEKTRIKGGNITMGADPKTGKQLTEPLLGIADTGEQQWMYPGEDYNFEGAKYVTEYPKGKQPRKAKNGLRQEQKSLQNLDNLVNFTNYNTKQPGGWLDQI